jgi:hypothetical protein
MSSHMFHPHNENISLKFDHYDLEPTPFIVFKISYRDNDISVFLSPENLPNFLKSMSDSCLQEIQRNKEIFNEKFNDNEDL